MSSIDHLFSEDSIRLIADLLNGDGPKLFTYKTGSEIFHFFNVYFGYHDRYTWGASYPSRWKITSNKIVEICEQEKILSFFRVILGLAYLHTEFPELPNDELANKREEIIKYLNDSLVADKIKVYCRNGDIFLTEINEDEVFLGKGGFAECYLIKSKNVVEKRLLQQYYLSSDIVSRFKKEFKITKELGKYVSGVIKVFDFSEQNLSYTMEKGDETLGDFLLQNPDLGFNDKMLLIFQILNTMSQVHARECVHRDLNPGNILMFGRMCKISDFGLGKDYSADTTFETRMTRNMGTLIYCDPVQLAKLKDGSYPSDIYSLAKIINFILTGNPTNEDHILRSVVQKGANETESLRYSSVSEMSASITASLKLINGKEKEEELTKEIERGIVNEATYNFVSTFSGKKLFDFIQKDNCRDTILKMVLSSFSSESDRQEWLNKLLDYAAENRITFTELDAFGYVSVPLLLSPAIDYVTKEICVALLNLPLDGNRFVIQNLVRSEMLGKNKIDPTLEEQIHFKY
jgi:serine/threonine protein kinase